ncbi:nucleotidyltransferase domain-containing protein [Nonomuraea aridisoli]|uniref:Amino acid transporter n=1 Tax=Nonomuraea aridisoli TaxID=2070368 RepID=A0A2W2EJX4_9ACTN|nr:amino acid transporter [Nonomuraea aridisoli]PZG05054.1 amino acid transporter [Nonomuraea aridisoli]
MRVDTAWGIWDHTPLPDVVALLRELRAPWWVAGGYAIERAVGRAYREHEDIDVALPRRDQLAARRLLDGWDPHVALDGTLRPWEAGETLAAQAHDIWVRERPGGPWRFQLMLDETDGGQWVYRRDHRIRRPLAGLTVADDGFRRLAPEVQLLYKAKGVRPKDEADFAAVLPVLTDDQRRWLAEALEIEHGTHPWLSRMSGL